MVQVDEAELDRVGDEEGVEDGLEEGYLVAGEKAQPACVEVLPASVIRLASLLSDALMLGGVPVLVPGLGAGVLGLGSGSADMARRVIGQSQETVHEEVEGAHGGDMIGIEAADEGVEGLGAHGIDPDVDGDDAAQDRGQQGAEHIFRGFGRSTQAGGVEMGDQRPQAGQVEQLQGVGNMLMPAGNAKRRSSLVVERRRHSGRGIGLAVE